MKGLAKAGPLDGVVKGLISGIRKKVGLTEEDVREAWVVAAGRQAAKHTRPASLKRSSLVVNVDGSSWLYELTLRKKDILKKLEDRLKDKKIKDIRFRIGEIK